MSFLTENDKRNMVVGAITLLALLFACMATIRLYEVVVPAHVGHDTINVTMADYEKALTKWKSKEPQEYIITTIDGNDFLTLRVRPRLDEVQELKHEPGRMQDPGDNPGFSPFLSSGHEAKQRTVAGLFDTAKEMLDLVSVGEPITPRRGETAYFHDFNIQFDPDLGYPKRIEHRIRTADPSSEIIWRKYGQSPKKVEKLEIVR